ncbi:hypothetical protein BC832DRAFT_568602, partial [Gaertneriomyces semiglobifer]
MISCPANHPHCVTDGALTENTKRVRKANKGTQPKGDDWRSALKSQIWSFIPRLTDTTTTGSWRECLIEIGKQFDTTCTVTILTCTSVPDVAHTWILSSEVLIDLRTSSPQLHSLPMEMSPLTKDSRYLRPKRGHCWKESDAGKLAGSEI